MAQVLRHGQYNTGVNRVLIFGLLFAVLPRAHVVTEYLFRANFIDRGGFPFFPTTVFSFFMTMLCLS